MTTPDMQRRLLALAARMRDQRRWPYPHPGAKDHARIELPRLWSRGREHWGAEPPERLFHGTADHSLAGIRTDGLRRPSERAGDTVFLTGSVSFARDMGDRKTREIGSTIVLMIRASDMVAAGHVFSPAPGGEWVTAHVPPEFIDFSGAQ